MIGRRKRVESVALPHIEATSRIVPTSLHRFEQSIAGRPYLIDAIIGADKNPSGAGAWELPGHGVSAPVIGGRYKP